MNNGAQLLCWGFVKGQDMDQGNNTQNVGSITANEGAVAWEDFEMGDWRGGTASSNIAFEEGRMLFPFQSYSLQNIEVPITYKYGSQLMGHATLMALRYGCARKASSTACCKRVRSASSGKVNNTGF